MFARSSQSVYSTEFCTPVSTSRLVHPTHTSMRLCCYGHVANATGARAARLWVATWEQQRLPGQALSADSWRKRPIAGQDKRCYNLCRQQVDFYTGLVAVLWCSREYTTAVVHTSRGFVKCRTCSALQMVGVGVGTPKTAIYRSRPMMPEAATRGCAVHSGK